MSLAFTTSFMRVFPKRSVRLQALTGRRSFGWHASTSVADSTRATISKNNVMVFSTTTCPYCAAVKSLFTELNVDHCVWELDTQEDGWDVREFLFEETGQRTVPNVFIRGKHVGGCDGKLGFALSFHCDVIICREKFVRRSDQECCVHLFSLADTHALHEQGKLLEIINWK